MNMLHILIIIVIIVCMIALAGTILVTKRLDDNYEQKKSFSSLSYIYFIGLPVIILAAVLIWRALI
ncbi:BshB3 potential contributor to bacillithiol synthesis [Oceanobacillus sp. CFH 90083]|uniref:BshB3 potential contributor to bacillithiol synthesis n=1 Tax=Oceanobacillus sp. CFH 90083 TaxID=2592336 RepID=UPI00128D8C96|nr:BshB3 potential contributor to bacillithiol synthesis [Oceanobacillus sp. CFH 90083]